MLGRAFPSNAFAKEFVDGLENNLHTTSARRAQTDRSPSATERVTSLRPSRVQYAEAFSAMVALEIRKRLWLGAGRFVGPKSRISFIPYA